MYLSIYITVYTRIRTSTFTNLMYVCDSSKWGLSTTTVVPGLPPLARDAVVPARHSLGVLNSTRAPLRNPRSGSC